MLGQAEKHLKPCLAHRHSNLRYQDEAPSNRTGHISHFPDISASHSPWPMDPDMWDSATLRGHSAMLAPAVGSDGNEDIAQTVWHYIGTRGEEEHSPLLIVLKTRGLHKVSP